MKGRLLLLGGGSEMYKSKSSEFDRTVFWSIKKRFDQIVMILLKKMIDNFFFYVVFQISRSQNPKLLCTAPLGKELSKQFFQTVFRWCRGHCSPPHCTHTEKSTNTNASANANTDTNTQTQIDTHTHMHMHACRDRPTDRQTDTTGNHIRNTARYNTTWLDKTWHHTTQHTIIQQHNTT